MVVPRALPIEALNIRTTPESMSNRRIIKIKRNSSFRGNDKDKVVPPEKVICQVLHDSNCMSLRFRNHYMHQ